MEDGKNLDLCLGLTCGGGSSSAKDKHGSSSENTLDVGDRERKLMNEFKNFLEGGIQHPQKPEENAYNNNPKAVVEIESSRSSASGGKWMTNGSRSEAETEKRSSLGEKRKNVTTDTNQTKKYEREANQPEKTHISITTDEGSTAENEDVADSEVDGSTSRQASQHDGVAKRFVENGTHSRAQQKEIHAYGDQNGADLLKPKRLNASSEKEFNITNMPFGASFPAQAVNMINMPYSQSQPLSSYPIPGMIHAMGGANRELPGIQSVTPANFPLMFGYNPVQLPILDKDNSRATISHHQQILPTYHGRNPINLDAQDDSRKLTQATMPVISQKSPESTQYEGRAIDHAKNNAKQHVTEEGSSRHAQGEPKGESLPSDFPAIRPGVAADLKFGGCGSYPNLPWVSTTGLGPNGRTISGVTYRYSPTQIRIVCACHGSHLSPEEFVRHASEENGTGLASFPNSNPATSAQS